MEENEILIKLVTNLLDNKYSKEEIKNMLPKIELLCDKAALSGKDLNDAIHMLFEFKENNILSSINEESIELIDYIHKVSRFFLKGDFLKFDITMKNILMPQQYLKCKTEEEAYQVQEEFNSLLYVLVSMSMQTSTFFRIIFELGKFNRDLFEIIGSENRCLADVAKKGRKEDIPVLNAVNRLYGILYFNLEKYRRDYKMVEELGKTILNNPDIYKDYCVTENMSYTPIFYEQLRNVYSGSIKLLDSANEKAILEKRGK